MKLTVKRRPGWEQDRDPFMMANDSQVLLDDLDITGSLQSLSLCVAHGEIVTCAIRIAPDDVDINAEVLADLEALLTHHREKEAMADDDD